MATGKNGFIMYREWNELFHSLSQKHCKALMLLIFAYVNDEHPPDPKDPVLAAIWAMMKPVFKRDLKKWEASAERSRENGRSGGRPKKPVYVKFDHLSMSVEEFDKLMAKGYTKQQVDETVLKIQNWKKNKNYKSLYLTCLNWLKSDDKKDGQNHPTTALEAYKQKLKG